MKKGYCSFPDPLLRLETIKKWAELFNEDCITHDMLLQSEERVPGYGLLNTLKGKEKSEARKVIDDIFYNRLLETARVNEKHYGFLVYAAAKDMYTVVTLYRDSSLFRFLLGFVKFNKTR